MKREPEIVLNGVEYVVLQMVMHEIPFPEYNMFKNVVWDNHRSLLNLKSIFRDTEGTFIYKNILQLLNAN